MIASGTAVRTSSRPAARAAAETGGTGCATGALVGTARRETGAAGWVVRTGGALRTITALLVVDRAPSWVVEPAPHPATASTTASAACHRRGTITAPSSPVREHRHKACRRSTRPVVEPRAERGEHR